MYVCILFIFFKFKANAMSLTDYWCCSILAFKKNSNNILTFNMAAFSWQVLDIFLQKRPFQPKQNPHISVYKKHGKYTQSILQVRVAAHCFIFLMTGNSIQTWMWVEKGVPGVSTCTV